MERARKRPVQLNEREQILSAGIAKDQRQKANFSHTPVVNACASLSLSFSPGNVKPNALYTVYDSWLA